LTETIIGEIGRKEAYLAVGYDEQSIRRLPRPKVQDRTQYTSRSLSWSTEDVVLITGGAKGITAECAIAFARLTGVKTALVGRSPHPQDDPLDASARRDRRNPTGVCGRTAVFVVTIPVMSPMRSLSES
jgi:hypothetical protein